LQEHVTQRAKLPRLDHFRNLAHIEWENHMRLVRLFPVLALLVALLIPAAALAAQPVDPKSLALTASDLGPGWTLSSEEFSETGYSADYRHQDGVVLLLAVQVHPSSEAASQALQERRQSDEQAGWSCQDAAIGDGPSTRCYLFLLDLHKRTFRVQNVTATLICCLRSVIVVGSGENEALVPLLEDLSARQANRIRDTLLPPPPPGPPFCEAGKQPEFAFGFAQLKARLGDKMGDPIECEHTNVDNGDSLLQTTTGLAFYRKATNTPTFTNGFEHWALTAQGPGLLDRRQHRPTTQCHTRAIESARPQSRAPGGERHPRGFCR
jgi:hypothetical protein